MNPDDVPTFDPDTGLLRVLIDTPAGSRNKYKFDASVGLFKISRVLPAGMVFPHDFGSVPGTRAEDGDPLDVLVLGLAPAFAGCLASVRLIGMLRAVQVDRGKRVRNDRLIGIAVTPVNRPLTRNLQALDPQHLRDIEEFFVAYNRTQGRQFTVTGKAGVQAAQRALQQAIRRFERSRSGARQ
ncbi:MAG TPA: inorganic diphosphatase [Steroidobacteraceae bacterium]